VRGAPPPARPRRPGPRRGPPGARAGARPGELAAEGVASVVVDCESGPVRLGLAGVLAADLGGPAVSLDGLRADSLAGLVKNVRTAVTSQSSHTNRRAA
ncbi:magnesium-chelatase subunit D, partial [Streptomyces goshikiensis]